MTWHLLQLRRWLRHGKVDDMAIEIMTKVLQGGVIIDTDAVRRATLLDAIQVSDWDREWSVEECTELYCNGLLMDDVMWLLNIQERRRDRIRSYLSALWNVLLMGIMTWAWTTGYFLK